MSSSRFLCAVACLLGCWSALGCRAAQVTRLNPGDVPERYRAVCRQSFAQCKAEAKSVCEGEFHVLEQRSNKPEQKAVQSSGVSSTGPSQGIVGWRGELLFQCGKQLAPLRLVRPASSAPEEPSASRPHVCVPGVTQVCLGPGACSGAQSCLPDATGFGPCDCGATSASTLGTTGPSATSPDQNNPATSANPANSPSASGTAAPPGAPEASGSAPQLAPAPSSP